MRPFKYIFFPILAFLLSGCGQSTEPTPAPPPTPEVVAAAKPMESRTAYQLFYQDKDYRLATFEPPEGCYLGAYILSNKKLDFDMDNFDQAVGKKHSTFLYNLEMSKFFPTTWILDCIAHMKTPSFVVTPPTAGVFDDNLLSRRAADFGEFYVPLLVQLYPNPRKYGLDPDQYKAFYKAARENFQQKASNAAFVWTVDGADLPGCMEYYPGDQYVDWVGINLYETLEEGGAYSQDLFSSLDYLYYLFQKKKPIMIAQLGISHYSSTDHVYRTGEAAAEIARVYGRLAEEYPRVKLVNYMDFNGIELSKDGSQKDNYSITDNEEVLAAYQRAVADSHYLEDLDVSSTGDVSPQWLRSPFLAYKVDGRVFLAEKTLSYDLGLQDLGEGKLIDGEAYHEATSLEGLGSWRMETDEDRQRIYLRSQ